MSTIRETVQNHIPTSYTREAEAALVALEGREAHISDELIRYAQRQGADPATIEELLESIGMTLPVKAAPAVEVPADRENGTALADRISRVEASVANLVALAERHLGSRV